MHHPANHFIEMSNQQRRPNHCPHHTNRRPTSARPSSDLGVPRATKLIYYHRQEVLERL